jgi:hypothetical protein
MESQSNESLVTYSSYSDKLDLSGKDLLAIFGKAKTEITLSTGLNFSEAPGTPISVPTEQVTSMTGVVADEVHEWPNANQGVSFRSLSLHFQEGLLISLEWNFSLKDFLPKKTPWYKKLI